MGKRKDGPSKISLYAGTAQLSDSSYKLGLKSRTGRQVSSGQLTLVRENLFSRVNQQESTVNNFF